MSAKITVALAGQPNTGKSTVFNLLTGTRQFVANYPGVTVEKKSGHFSVEGRKYELIDLPGIYSMTSYSLEERVARDFLLEEKPALTINVVDAANLKRNLYLTFQLLEMGLPLVVVFNMMDVVEGRGDALDLEAISRMLTVPVVAAAAGKGGRGRETILAALSCPGDQAGSFRLDYGVLEPSLAELEKSLAESEPLRAFCSPRWLAVKLLEGDSQALNLLARLHPLAVALAIEVERLRDAFEQDHEITPEGQIALRRHEQAVEVEKIGLHAAAGPRRESWTNRIDKFVCHRYCGPLLLVGVVYLMYELAIVQGYNLTNYTWPLLARFRQMVDALLPLSGFIEESHGRGLALWVVDSVNGLLNYVPVFFILFLLIAILEDIGYMPRMAFILDRVFRRFGLHGQSTLPLILSGVVVGGCCVPGVMACKGIADEKARFATILVSPYMNCLAKTPFYLLLIGIYFGEHKTIAFLFVSTVTIFIALPVAKILTLTLLQGKESTPFVMEMPRYHLPTVKGVLLRAWERVWLYVKKVTSVVAAVAVVVYLLLQFPGLTPEQETFYQERAKAALAEFGQVVRTHGYVEQLPPTQIMALLDYWNDYKQASLAAGAGDEARAGVERQFSTKNPLYYSFLKPGKEVGKLAVNRAVRKLLTTRKSLSREIRQEKINRSFLGRTGRALEPVTRWAGFNWRVNVALLSCLAAKESAVATLGALYEPPSAESGLDDKLEERMRITENSMTPLHALSIILFMALYPPCLATMIMIKLQTNSWKWMIFSLVAPIVMGVVISILVFSGGRALGLNGWQAMAVFYLFAVIVTVALALVKDREGQTCSD
ncbi:MAG TPA: ferrous iron transport protein B [Proteobacteria bacterium]|nr:ferrous iron transport protein B [Pseudomonadota bacterium]